MGVMECVPVNLPQVWMTDTSKPLSEDYSFTFSVLNLFFKRITSIIERKVLFTVANLTSLGSYGKVVFNSSFETTNWNSFICDNIT